MALALPGRYNWLRRCPGALAPGAWGGRLVLYKEGLLHQQGEDMPTACQVETAVIGPDPD